MGEITARETYKNMSVIKRNNTYKRIDFHFAQDA